MFKWGTIAWRQEFETGSLGSTWQTNGSGTIGQQNGMLTIQAAADSGTVEVWPDDAGAATADHRAVGGADPRLRAVHDRHAVPLHLGAGPGQRRRQLRGEPDRARLLRAG